MARYHEVSVLTRDMTVALTSDVTVFNWTSTDTTLTPTRVDTATAGSATANIVFSATDATAAANAQVEIRALGGIYATATVVAGATADNIVITVLGGYDVTWAKTGGVGTITETGAAGSDTAVPGKASYTATLPAGRFFIAKRITARTFVDKNLDISLVDAGSKDIFVKTALDTGTASYDKFLTADGVAGEDGAAAANASGGLFDGPIAVTIATSAPNVVGNLSLFVDGGNSSGSSLKLRSTGTFTAATATVNLGSAVGNIRRIKILATSDTTIAPEVTDAYGKILYTKSATDYTTVIDKQLSAEGVDQAANAVADTLDVIAKSPVTVTLTGSDATGFKVSFYTEV